MVMSNQPQEVVQDLQLGHGVPLGGPEQALGANLSSPLKSLC